MHLWYLFCSRNLTFAEGLGIGCIGAREASPFFSIEIHSHAIYVGSFFNGDQARPDFSLCPPACSDLNPILRSNISRSFSAHDDFPSFDLRDNPAIRPDGQFATSKANFAVDLAINEEIVLASNIPVDHEGLGQATLNGRTGR